MEFEMCRICRQNEGVFNIFNDSIELQLSAKIMYCCRKVSVSRGDGLPAQICAACESELQAAYGFVVRCERADAALRVRGVPLAQAEPKVEIKLEDTTAGHDPGPYDDYAPLELKPNSEELKEETREKSTERLYRKRMKCDVGVLMCSECGRVSASRAAHAAHLRSHSSAAPHACAATGCDKRYKDAGSLRRHAARHHAPAPARARNFTCETCGKGFYSRNDVKIHMRTHTGETPYKCAQCAAKFTQASALLRHRRRHTGEKPHACPTCAKRFCTHDEMRHHLRVHSSEKNYSCPICNVPFKYKNNLRKHIALHSKRNSFVCDLCGRTFNQKGNLRSHMARQHSERSGECTVCCKSVSDLEKHMWRHTGQRPLACPQCPSRFYEQKALARHVNYRHERRERFACAAAGCGAAFPSRPMLRHHAARAHDTAVPFPCDRCPRAFYRKNDLARHKIATHKERLTN